MPGFPTAPAVQTITDKLATIAPELGNVAGYYVYLKDPIAGTIYESATPTDGAGNWSIVGVTMGLTYQYSYGKHPNTAYPFQGAYVASNPPLAITFLTPSGADDSAALQAAHTALPATGGKILMGSGSWNLATRMLYQLLSNQHVALEGQGQVTINSTVAEPSPEGAALEYIGASDGTSRLTLRSFKVSHTNSGNGLVDCIMIRYPTWPNSAPTNRSVSRFIAEDLVLTGASKTGMRPVYTDNGRIVNCAMSSNRYCGLAALGDRNLHVIGGDFSSNVSGTLLGDYGIAFDSSSVVPYAQSCKVMGAQALNNGRKGFDVHHGHDIQFLGVTAIGNGYVGIYAVAEDLTKDCGDITIIGGHVDMAGANTAAGATLGIQVGSATGPNAAQKPGTFTIIGPRLYNVDSTNNVANSAIYINNPPSGPAANKVIISAVTVENVGTNPCRFVTSESNGVAIPYIEIADCIVHLAVVANTSPVIWLQQVTTVKIADNTLQVDAGTIGNFVQIPSTAQGSVNGNQFNGVAPTAPSNYVSFGGGTSATIRQWGNSQNGKKLADYPPPAGMFGDGSDGAFTCDGSATPAWASRAGSVYTMNRDAMLTTLTVNAGSTLVPQGFRVFCTVALVNKGLIHSNGNAAAGATGGATLSLNNSSACFSASATAGTAGANGGTGVGGGGGAQAGGLSAGGAGGAGGNNVSVPNAGGAGGSATGTTVIAILRTGVAALSGRTPSATSIVFGAGGGAGGGDGTNAGGGGGGGAGAVCIGTAMLDNTGGTIQAKGGAGAAGVAGNAAGGGGGGGGALVLNYQALIAAGTLDVTGGALGAGVGTGNPGVAGSSGNTFQNQQ